jgi:hypothetical protein
MKEETTMQAEELLTKLHSLLQQLASECIAVVNDSGQAWSNIKVSIQWVGDGGACDIVIESMAEQGVKYHFPSMAAYHLLMPLWSTNRQLDKPWSEIRLNVSADGQCDIQFGYGDDARE